jgi:hypothetical protein
LCGAASSKHHNRRAAQDSQLENFMLKRIAMGKLDLDSWPFGRASVSRLKWFLANQANQPWTRLETIP